MAKMPATSFLETFKLVPVDVKEAAKGEPIVIARKRVIEGIKVQKDAVEKELRGESLPTTRFTNAKGQDRTRGFTKWYFTHSGKVMTYVRYGQSSVFNDGKTAQAFEAGNELADLPAFYDALIGAVEKGELDKQLLPLQAETSRRTQKTGGRKKAA